MVSSARGELLYFFPNEGALTFGFSKAFSSLLWIIFRGILFFYSLSMFIWSFVELRWLIYLTHWTITLETMYFLLAWVTSIMYHVLKPRTVGDIRRIKPLIRITWALQEVALLFAILIVILYWSFEYKGNLDSLTIHLHGINALLMLVDKFFSSSRTLFGHIWLPYLYGFLYIAFSIIYFAYGGKDVKGKREIYTLLDYHKREQTTGYIALINLAIMPLVQLFCIGVDRLGSRIFNTGARARAGTGTGVGGQENKETFVPIAGLASEKAFLYTAVPSSYSYPDSSKPLQQQQQPYARAGTLSAVAAPFAHGHTSSSSSSSNNSASMDSSTGAFGGGIVDDVYHHTTATIAKAATTTAMENSGGEGSRSSGNSNGSNGGGGYGAVTNV